MAGTINIFGFIGSDWDGTTLKQVSEQLEAISDNEVIVKISSGGGYVNEGLAIFNLLRNSKKDITVHIIGQAYSIASVIAMAGKKIYIAEFADMMLHPAWTFTEGNAEDLRKTADELDAVSDELFKTYLTRDKAKDSETTLKSYFEAEKFIKADECITLGLCDGLLEDQNAVKYLTKYKAVAYFDKPKQKEMSENKETKTLLDDFKAWFEGIKSGFKASETEETETPEQLKEKITALEGEIATLKGEKEATEAKVVTLTTEVEALNNVKNQFEAKIKEVEDMVLGAENPDKKKKEGNEKTVPAYETVAQKMKRLDAENRKKYNQN